MTIQSIQHKNNTINIVYDESPECPREWDTLGTMICFHKRYTLGDKHNFKSGDYNSWEEMEKVIAKQFNAVVLPIYLYDHSGITINTTGFNCKWDSGQIGFIAISKEKVRTEFGWKNITKSRKKQLIKSLESEVETYDSYLRGEVFGFEVKDNNGEIIDSCYGFYSQEGAIICAKGNIDVTP